MYFYLYLVSDVALSDHCCVFFECDLSVNKNVQSEFISKRYITENTSDQFIQAFSTTAPLSRFSANDLVEDFTLKITNIIDAIAPMKSKVFPNKKKSPWRNTILVQLERKECRKAERRWRKTKLQVHYDIYKDKLHLYNLQLRKSRQIFFSDIITKTKNNARALFATVDRLTNPPKPVASEHLSTKACTEFAHFFNSKIQTLRQAVRTTARSSRNVLSVYPPKDNSFSVTQFDPINDKTLQDILQDLKPSSCCLDILPSQLFKDVSECLRY